MPAEEIAFRVAFDGPLTEFSRKNPGASVSLWCDWKREALEVGGAGPEAIQMLRDHFEGKSWIEEYSVDEDHHVFLVRCTGLPHDFVMKAIDEARCIALPPTRMEDGWEVYHVVSFGDTHSRQLFKALRAGDREVELLSKRTLRVNPLLNTPRAGVGALFDGLTDKQAEALVLAHRHGLYASPRRVTAADIADGVGVSRSTYEEHLRKAESRIVGNLMPYLELHVKARKAKDAKPGTN